MENNNLNNFLEELNNIKTDEDCIEIENLETLFSDDYVKSLVDNNVNINDLSEKAFKDSVLKKFDDDKNMQDLIKDSYALIINTLLDKCDQEMKSRQLQNLQPQQELLSVQPKQPEEATEEKSEQEKISNQGSDVNAQGQPLSGQNASISIEEPILQGQDGLQQPLTETTSKEEQPELSVKDDNVLAEQPEEATEEKSEQEKISNQGSDVNAQQPLTEVQNAIQPVGTQMQEINRLEPTNQATPAMLAMNREDIVKGNNVRLAKLITNAKTESQIDRIRESEAQVLASLLMHANKNIDALKKDNENLKTLIEKSNRCLDKIDTKKQTQFKKTENAINSRTHLTGMKIEVIEPVIPDNIDFADLDAMMNDFEEDFNAGYENLEAANSNYDQLFSYYKNGLETLSLKK